MFSCGNRRPPKEGNRRLPEKKFYFTVAYVVLLVYNFNNILWFACLPWRGKPAARGRRRLPGGKAEPIVKICGLQKLTLLDYPGKVACTVFTGGCNLRCPFCHNAPLVLGGPGAGDIGEEELFAFLKKRRGVLDGVCVTGGEPLLQPDIFGFISRLKNEGYAVKLDTNGCFPEKLAALAGAGLLDYVAMDIKSAPESYAEAAGVPGFDIAPVRESIAFLQSGTVESEFRTTVVRGLHDAAKIRGAAEAIRGAKRYFLQKFVDSGDLVGSGFSAFSDGEMRKFLKIAAPYVQNAALRGVDDNERSNYI